jgi:unsaturated chondroitin disaccharide hydrolase
VLTHLQILGRAETLAALKAALTTIRRTVPRMGSQQPSIGQSDFTYKRCTDDEWVNGFWSGQLWLAFAYTQDPFFLSAGRQQRPYFTHRLARSETHDHDLGFLYSLSVVADYKLTGDSHARELGLAAAASLASRFNPKGRFIRAWNDTEQDGTTTEFRRRRAGKFIIDCTENLALLCWATNETGEDYYQEIATEHALTSVKYLVRPDGSTYHTYDIDPDTGQPLGGVTLQGYADESCWSRGQGWAIHGFAQTYVYTRLPLFLQTACLVADHTIAQLPPDYVPFWDYRLPPEAPHYRDSSAGAITSAGLFLLADQLETQDSLKAEKYREVARLILLALSEFYTTKYISEAEGLLKHGCSFAKIGLSDNMLPYGDYFYMEALLRNLGWRNFFW